MGWFYCEKAPQRGGETTLCDGVKIAADMPDELRDLFEGRSLCYPRTMGLAESLKVYDAPSREALQKLINSSGWSDVLRLEGDRLVQDLRVPAFPELAETGEQVFVNQILFNARIRPWVLKIAGALGVIDHPRAPGMMALNRLSTLAKTQPGRGLPAFPLFEDGSRIPGWAVARLRDLVHKHEIRLRWKPNDVLVFNNRRYMHGRRKLEDPNRRLLTRFGAPAWPAPDPDGLKPNGTCAS